MSFFDDTIISNITLEDNIDVVDKSKLDFSIKKSGLEKFVNGLEHGLKTNIGELGVRISGGERQRLSIIRTILLGGDILFFDEPTSSLDLENEKIVMKEIQKLKKDKIIIVSTHKKGLKRYFDNIIHL